MNAAANSLTARSSPAAEAEILRILSQASDFADIQAAGLLFHGTCEAIKGPLRPGGYDDVFWTAETPSVAQAYIPRAGSSRLLPCPNPCLYDEVVRPTRSDDPIMQWALSRCSAQWDDLEVETDGRRPASWNALPGWPTFRDLANWIADDLGYGRPEEGYWSVSCDRDAMGQEIFRPADWQMPGMLLIIRVPDLVISDPPWSEEALDYKPHNRIADFERFAEEGLDAFHMSDLLQSDYLGNLSHRAVGLLPAALERAEWIAIPAGRFDTPDAAGFAQPLTPDFENFLSSLRREDAPAPGL